MIENGSRSEGIPGVFQATRVVLYAKAALPGVMGSALFGYTTASLVFQEKKQMQKASALNMKIYRAICSFKDLSRDVSPQTEECEKIRKSGE